MTERRPYSLAARLALITAAWSACALLLTGAILAELFRADAEREFDARIQADLVNLVRDAVSRPAGEPALPVEPLGPLFREPFSGWAWQVRRGDEIVAQSGSLGPLIDGVMEPLLAPEAAPADFIAPGGIPSRGAARPILLGGASEPLIFAVARPRAEIDANLSYFSNLLLYSLAVFGAVMFAASLLLTRIMLAPVTRLEEAVRRMRDGETEPLESRWPNEIMPVINELKDLNAHIDRLVERSRNQASDLAHALKTPLSIMRQAAEQAPAGTAEPLVAQLERIERSLDWHLTRRRLAGPHYSRVKVSDVTDDVLFAMSRLFNGRELDLASQVETNVHFIGDEEDLHEMLGNLVENACKWANGQVTVAGAISGDELHIRVDDDGPGIPDHVAEAVFQRGARFDETAPGHGHGLAIVRDITGLYGGTVDIGASAAGGASIRLTLPGVAEGAALATSA
ncbi:MAG: ATP-binding protein [Paracoccaceae bacterium]